MLQTCPLRSHQLISIIATTGAKCIAEGVNFLADAFDLPRLELGSQRAVKRTAESFHHWEDQGLRVSLLVTSNPELLILRADPPCPHHPSPSLARACLVEV